MTLPRRWFSADDAPAGSGQPKPEPGAPRVVVVGPCAAGKSTLAEGLRRLGFSAMPVGQEHSEIPSLWQHTDPDVVVALDADLDTIRRRRGEESWPEWLYLTQQRRLQEAQDAAALRIDTAAMGPDDVLATVAAFLARIEREDESGQQSAS